MEQQLDLDKYLIIVNKNHPLTPEKEELLKKTFNYVPYNDEDGESCLEEETFKAYTALVKHMKNKYFIDVEARSAWRSIETQKKVMEELRHSRFSTTKRYLFNRKLIYKEKNWKSSKWAYRRAGKRRKISEVS